MRNRLKGNKLNNQGFSLLELLIVIAIIAVFSVTTIFGISAISKGNAKKMNKNLYSSLSQLKTSTMSKTGKWQIVIKKQDNDLLISVMRDSKEKETYKCSASRVNLVYNDGTDHSIKDDELVIEFSRDDGSVKSITYGGTDISDKQHGKFIVTAAGRSYETELWYKTGRVTTVN